MKSSSKAFISIEKFTNTKIPQFLKKVLISHGFQTEFSLLNITSETIKKIENDLSASKNRDILKKTKYEKLSENIPFKFDLADECSLLSIPKLIQRANNEKKTRVSRKKEKKHC